MNNGRLKVADFGIARIDTSDLTQFGMIMGTPGYMAPEQYVNSDIDCRADIFAAGVIFYQLLAGVKPFTGSAELICHKICNEEHLPPSQVDPGRNLAHFDSVISKALAKKTTQRFETAKAFRDAILEAYSDPVSLVLSEETIIDSATSVKNNDPNGQVRTTANVIATGTTGYPSGWDIDTLLKIEKRLTKLVGPVARVMIKRAAKVAADVNELYDILSNELENIPDRTLFLASKGDLGLISTSTNYFTDPNNILPDFKPSEEHIERATRQLASFVGPIAKILVKKAASKAISPENFYLLLSENLTEEKEKQSFLRIMQK
jgi:serine/threonine-protein kinase